MGPGFIAGVTQNVFQRHCPTWLCMIARPRWGERGGSTHIELHQEHFCAWDGIRNPLGVAAWHEHGAGPQVTPLCAQVGAVRGAQLPRPHVRGGAWRVQQLQRVAGTQCQRPVHQESRQLLLAELPPCQPWPAETEHHPPTHPLTPGINC